MRLQSLKFTENEDTAQEWSLEGLQLGDKNLIVGKNSVGKSRTLNVIHALSRYLAGLQAPTGTSYYDAHFLHEQKKYHYTVRYVNDEVVNEKLTIDNVPVLSRKEGGEGIIFAEKIGDGTDMNFQSPTKDFAVVSRRDSIQHSFLEPLYTWASSLRYYPFGSTLGKDLVAFIIPNAPKVDERDSSAALGIFREGYKIYKEEFTNLLIKDLAKIDYHVKEIGVNTPTTIKLLSPAGEAVGLYVKESDLPGITDQFSMSSGMFRVLSLLIQINFFYLNKLSASVLIDDIGEGLDFDRSCRLIELLRIKASESDLQIILSTNDKFVMNSVPLDEWSILQRVSNKVTVRNLQNSAEIFNEFKFTGLSNFSLLEYDYLNENQK